MIRTLQDLRDVYGENTEAFTKFLGRKEAIALALALTGRNAENVDKIYRSVSDTTENLDQATERMAETMQFQLNQSMAVFREIGIEIVTKVLPPLASGLNTIANLFRTGGDPIAGYREEFEKLFSLDANKFSSDTRALTAFVETLENADAAPENLGLIAEFLERIFNVDRVSEVQEFGVEKAAESALKAFEEYENSVSADHSIGVFREIERGSGIVARAFSSLVPGFGLVHQGVSVTSDVIKSQYVPSTEEARVATDLLYARAQGFITDLSALQLDLDVNDLSNVSMQLEELGFNEEEVIQLTELTRIGLNNLSQKETVFLNDSLLKLNETFGQLGSSTPFVDVDDDAEVIKRRIEVLREEAKGLVETFDKQLGDVDFDPTINDLKDLYSQLIETARRSGDAEEATRLFNEAVGLINPLLSRKKESKALEDALVDGQGPISDYTELLERQNQVANSFNLSNVRNQIATTGAVALKAAQDVGFLSEVLRVTDAVQRQIEPFNIQFEYNQDIDELAKIFLGTADAAEELEDAADGAGGAVETLASKIGTFRNTLIDTAVDQVLFIALQGDFEGAVKKMTEVLDGQIPRWNALSEIVNLTRQLIEQEVTESFQKFKDSQEEASEETEKYTTILDNFQSELKETAIEQAILAALSGDTTKAIEALSVVTSDSIKNLAAQQAAIEVLVAWYDQEYNKVLEEHRKELGLTSDETESYVSNLEDMRSKLVDVAVEQAVLAARQGNVAQAFDIANAAANGQVKELNSVLAAIDVVRKYIEQQFNRQWEEYVEAQENATEAAEGFISAIDEMQGKLTSVAAEQVLMTALQGDVAGAMDIATAAANGQIKELNTLSAASQVIQKFISQQFTQAWNDYTEAQQEAEEATRTFSDVLDTMSSAITRTIADMAFAAIVTGDFAKATEALSQVNDENSKAIFAAQHVYQLLTDFINQEFTKAFEDATDEIDDQRNLFKIWLGN